jgi:hypothetical protein
MCIESLVLMLGCAYTACTLVYSECRREPATIEEAKAVTATLDAEVAALRQLSAALLRGLSDSSSDSSGDMQDADMHDGDMHDSDGSGDGSADEGTAAAAGIPADDECDASGSDSNSSGEDSGDESSSSSDDL